MHNDLFWGNRDLSLRFEILENGVSFVVMTLKVSL
jgi:hypothetical protein